MIAILIGFATAGLWGALMLVPWRRVPELVRRTREPSPPRRRAARGKR